MGCVISLHFITLDGTRLKTCVCLLGAYDAVEIPK